MKITKEEYEEKLKSRREYIRKNTEYFGTQAPSKCNDYIRYKTMLKEMLK